MASNLLAMACCHSLNLTCNSDVMLTCGFGDFDFDFEPASLSAAPLGAGGTSENQPDRIIYITMAFHP